MPRSQISLTITDEAAIEFVCSTVRNGEYASESDVIHEGLKALKEESEERERWEREVLLPAHDRLMADPSSAIPIEQVERNLEARRRQRLKAS
jgi:Arc/MetJ-type ribon-helix-helix transcriptional regulator